MPRGHAPFALLNRSGNVGMSLVVVQVQLDPESAS
jgi:hypothetical protein